MAKRVFYSFHYIPDNWRASQVRNIGSIEGNRPASDNDWETITKKGDDAIQNWIDQQMDGRSCCAVLIGTNTAGRKWINYEIKKAWNDGRGVFGIHIHSLKDSNGMLASPGANPFDGFTIGSKSLSSIVKAYDPPGRISTSVYAHIESNISSWIDEACRIRRDFKAS